MADRERSGNREDLGELGAFAGLPPIEPSPVLDVKVRDAAHNILAEGPGLPHILLYRVALPTLLSGATATYLIWAFQAAIGLY